jgi:hypothetical protein
MKSRIAAPVLIALALLAGPALTGCSFLQNPVEGIIEGATGGEVDLPSTELPDDFPTEVPLYDGEIANTIALGDGDAKVYSVSIRVPGINTMDEIVSDFEAAGFTSTISGNSGEGATAAFESDKWSAVVVIVAEGDTGYIAQYAVSAASK